ncbi:LytTR family DNA-binding domain-containing protein [Litorimonas sp.]|uniref:LytTR family DNA-binding domain-containing protein n=1 Tax=Litorimonas sp. TaxID=1892381 RepID=UPI003A88B8E4
MKAVLKHFIPMIITSAIAGVILSILGPFGTIHMPFTGRFLYWVGLCVAGGFGAGAVELISHKFGRNIKIWQEAIGQSIGATLCVAALIFILFPPNNWQNIVLTFFYVWLISIILCSIGLLLGKQRSESRLETQATRPPLLDRLPPKLRHAEIYAISAEDHYVRVHSSAGDEMILMRLSDAVREAAALSGVQTHRSWWVAEKGVESINKTGGKIDLVLKNGLSAPVSRSGQKQVRDAGWI